MDDHVCELPMRHDYQHPFTILLTPKVVTQGYTWAMWCSVSNHNPETSKYIDSMAGVKAERRRHGRFIYWWVIHPWSYIRFLWEMIMMIVYSVALITIPFMVSFVIMDYERIRLDKINLPIYVACWVDILSNCVTGYNDVEQMEIELDPVKIWKKYAKGYLLIDVLSSLPYDHFTLHLRRLPGDNSSSLISAINTLPLLKIFRYPTLSHYTLQFCTYFNIKTFSYEIYTTLLLAGYLIFWFACFCYLTPILIIHFLNLPVLQCEGCWIRDIKGENLAFKFQHAIFIVLESMSASGYGLFIPRTDGHITLAALLMIVGRFIEGYIIITLLKIKAGEKASQTKFQEIVNQVDAYTRQKQLPLHMKNRLLAFYHYRFKESYFREKVILAGLSEYMRVEIALDSCRRLVENAAIFKNLPKQILQSIVKNLKYELYLPNDVIVKAGSQGDCMYFLSTGTVAVLTPTGKEICHLEDGAHFGEVALLVPDQRRVASVIAIEVCEIYRLDRKDFRKCIAIHSELFAKIERIATERVERAIVVEEEHKRHMMRGSTFVHEEIRKYFQKT